MGTGNTATTKALTGFGNLLKILPTGTVFLFHFLNPIVTNNGSCSTTNKWLTSFLIGLCGVVCILSSFVDSYKDSNGSVHYGLATFTGLYPAGSAKNPTSYRLRAIDFVHAFFSVVVFGALSLLYTNTVTCLYPSFESIQKALLQSLPLVSGVISSAVFAIFPSKRHGVGYSMEDTP